MLASYPASMVNQKQADLGIPNRFNLTPSRFRSAKVDVSVPSVDPLSPSGYSGYAEKVRSQFLSLRQLAQGRLFSE